MKVKELIAELEKFDPETEVFKYDGDGDYYKDEGEDDSELKLEFYYSPIREIVDYHNINMNVEYYDDKVRKFNDIVFIW